MRVWVFFICLALIGAQASRVWAEETVRIFGAASLRGGLEAALQASGLTAQTSYGGSGAMARQVAAGAPADLVILANVLWADWLREKQPNAAAPRDLLGNALVLIGPRGADPFSAAPTREDLLNALGGQRLAMGAHRSVPAGQYAADWLKHIGAWDTLRPHLAQAENVRVALAYVARGEAPLGIVYRSDAVAEPRVSVLWAIEPALYPVIRYPAMALTPRGMDALEALLSAPAQAAFAASGFLPPPEANR